jgi:hypothetical protein
MRQSIGFALLGLLISPALSWAQTVSPGKYAGNMQFVGPAGKPWTEMVTLTVDKVDGDQISGVAWVGTKFCQVDTPVQGRLEGDILKVRGAPVKEKCGINWELKVVGNKLEGKTVTGNVLTLSK